MELKFSEVKLSDKDIFNKYLAGRYHELITYNFSTFYLWRDWDPYAWGIVNDTLCVTSNYIGLDTVLVPISPDDKNVISATETLIKWYQETGRDFIISEVSEGMLAFYEQHMPGCLTAEEYIPGGNYIYLTQDLCNLAGKKFDGKRNHIHHFVKHNPDYELVDLGPELVPICKEKLVRWTKEHHPDDPEVAQEILGVFDCLDHLSDLDCDASCLLAEGQPVAFTMGEALNADTYCVHIEKGDISVRGAYQAINYLHARKFCTQFKYINRAEDMENEGQRRAKMSYHPCRIAKKYYLRLAK